MPFINGRYHMNAIMGQALEAAREAEAAMRALQNRGSRSAGASRASSASDSPRDASADPLDDDSAAPQDSSSDDASADQARSHVRRPRDARLCRPRTSRALRFQRGGTKYCARQEFLA
jgi:hypothetical protein